MPTQREMIEKLFGRGGQRPAPLPRQTVDHDSVDKAVFGNFTDDSPRFHRIAVDDAPKIAPDVPAPDPIDFTSASTDEIKAWQAEERKAQAARDNVDPYDAWENLTRDIFYSYHHPTEPEIASPDQVDPAVSHHSKIASRMTAEDAHQQSRNITRDDATASAIATMAASNALRDALEEELIEQARQSEEIEDKRSDAEAAQQDLDDLRQSLPQDGSQPSPELVDAIKQAVKDKRAAQAAAAQAAAAAPKPMDKAAADAVAAAAVAGQEAAEAAGQIPSFGEGFGTGEPRYESPEQALSIADAWANNQLLRQVAELYGRVSPDMRFERAKRVVGGEDEIVDLKFGDEIKRAVPFELALLADEDYEDDFLMRYLSSEISVHDTVGDENVGRGPIVLACDESYSMQGERNIWSKAISMCLLNIARREKRDFAYIGFASGTDVNTFLFPAKQELDPQQIIDCASHFFAGGTSPVLALAQAEQVMKEREFKKADIVMVTDGEATFGTEDKRIRDLLTSRGVRLHGIGIGGDTGGKFRYLDELTEDVVHVNEFDLESPSEATAHLATHIS